MYKVIGRYQPKIEDRKALRKIAYDAVCLLGGVRINLIGGRFDGTQEEIQKLIDCKEVLFALIAQLEEEK